MAHDFIRLAGAKDGAMHMEIYSRIAVERATNLRKCCRRTLSSPDRVDSRSP
jgi:hypothetical protein